MKLKMPAYCGSFRCIASDCKDSCCIGWEIDIDEKTAAKYNSVSGKFGERLKNNISCGSFILDENERCPFLNEKNLCDIIINLGEEYLCQICDRHPRYFEWFSGVKEGGIGLACEEAARIILTAENPYCFTETEIPDEPCDDYDETLFSLLDEARNQLFSMLKNKEKPLNERLLQMLCYGEKLQNNLDFGELVLPELSDEMNCGKISLQSVLKLMQDFEPMEETRPQYLSEQLEMLTESEKISISECSAYLENIAVYFIWRYFMKGVFDGEILSKIRLAAVSVQVIGNMFQLEKLKSGSLTEEKCILLAKTYSKETEYSEENISELLFNLE